MRFNPKVFIKEIGYSYCVIHTVRGFHNYCANLSLTGIAINKLKGKELSLIHRKRVHTDAKDDEKIRCGTKTKRSSLEILNHLEQSTKSCNVHSIPSKLLRKAKRFPEGLYLISDETAKTLAENVIPHILPDDDVPLFEINPGLGVLTRLLLESGYPQIHTLQTSYWNVVYELLKDYQGRVHMHKHNFFALSKYILVEGVEHTEEVKTILAAIKPKKWNDGPSVRIIAAIPDKLFLNRMIISVLFQKGFELYGRTEYFLIMKPVDFLRFTASKESGYTFYRPRSVLFQILFNYTLITKLPRKDFIPWEYESKPKKKAHHEELRKTDEDYIYLVKVAPRQDLLDVVNSAENLLPLWHFVCHCFTRKDKRVIPMLEHWIPGCGPRLIFKGMTIYTQFKDLSPPEVLDLFIDFTHWPEYKKCPFLPSLQTAILKLQVDRSKLNVEMEEIDENIEIEPIEEISIPDEGEAIKY